MLSGTSEWAQSSEDIVDLFAAASLSLPAEEKKKSLFASCNCLCLLDCCCCLPPKRMTTTNR
jgi:hypothetical protein